MAINIERISDEKCQLGESPFWDEKSQSVYFVDAFGKTINRYTPSTKTYVSALLEKNVSFIIPIQTQQNVFLIGYGNEIAKLTWDGTSDQIQNVETIIELKNTDEKTHRFNDGKIDPSGQLWAGMFIRNSSGGFDPNQGALFRLKSDRTLETLISGVTLSNGLVWNEKIEKFYYIDTDPGEVYQFDYKNREITNRKVIFRFKDNGIEGGPDGMTIDTDGKLWIASFGGSKIIRIDPDQPNTVLRTIDMPVKQVTCVEFGGPNYEDLYVTTAGIPIQNVPNEGGWTYKITGLGVKGLPARRGTL